MVRLWLRMTELYEEQWTAKKGDVGGVTFDKWVDQFADVSGPDIARGLKTLRENLPKWPPNLAEFMRMCAGVDSTSGPPRTYSSKVFQSPPDCRALEDQNQRARRQAAAAKFFERARTLSA